jgi:hypothetical protein
VTHNELRFRCFALHHAARQSADREGAKFSMPQRNVRSALVRLTGVLALGALSGCSGATFAELPVIGMPAGMPQRPAEPPAFPAVYERPEPRADAPLSAEEQAKLTSDLETLRARQSGQTRGSGASGGRKPVQRE